jgi:hypothetical protein
VDDGALYGRRERDRERSTALKKLLVLDIWGMLDMEKQLPGKSDHLY